MATAFFGYGNAVDAPGATIAYSSQLSNLPASNVIDPDLQRVWVTANADDAWVAAVFPSAHSIRCLGLGGWLATSGATIRRRLYSDTGMSTTVYDSGWVSADVQEGYWTSVEVLGSAVANVRAARVDISDAARATTVVNGQFAGDHIVGRLWVSSGEQPAYNMGYPYNEEMCELTEKQRGRRSGAVSVDPGPQYRKISFGYEALTEAEGRGSFKEFLRKAGIGKQVLFVPEPGGTYQPSEAMFCKRAETSPVVYADLPMWQNAMTLEEDPALGS